MTREELKEHCKKQIEMCEMWAKARGENPSGKVYEEHKMVLELLEQEPCDDCISREDVLDAINDIGSGAFASYSYYSNLFDFVCELSPVEPDKCDDCISREALDDAISNLTYWHFENGRLITGGGGSKAETVYKVDDVTRLTHILPPVTSQPKMGHWINIDATHSKCDRCGAIFEIASENGEANFCPNCGAKMVEPQESEGKLDGDPIDIDKAIEHYEGTLEMLKGVGLEVNG